MTEKEKIQKGYLYCVHNEMFNFYGKKVKKLGKTIDIDKRISCYDTGYLEKTQLMYLSNEIRDYTLGEKLLFLKLREFRLKLRKEFFDCELSIVVTCIKEVETMLALHDSNEIDKFLDNMANQIKQENEEKYKLEMKNISNAHDISDDVCYNMINLDAAVCKNYEVKKHIFKKIWNIDNIDEKFVVRVFERTDVIRNFRCIKNISYINKLLYNAQTKIELKKNINYILKILNLLGFKDINEAIIVNKDDFEKIVNKIVNDKQNKKEHDEITKYYNITRSIYDGKSSASMLGYINSITKFFGFKITASQKSFKLNKKVIKKNYYKIVINIDIKQYL